MKNRIIGIITTVVIATGLLSFTIDYFQISKNIDVFSALYRDVNTTYVDDVEPSKLMRTCIDGMLKTLDPFTNYFSGSQIETAKMQQGGKFGGLGMEFEIMNDYPVITSVTQNQPADINGLKPGDMIKSIDGANTKDKKKDEVEKVLVGEPNSRIALTVERKTSLFDTKTLFFNIQRQEIQETNVPFYGMVAPEVACIKLKIFNEGAARDVRQAFDTLRKKNPGMKGLILDLRGNGGGLLNEAVNIVNLFIERDKLVVTTKGKVDEWNSTFKTTGEPLDAKIPVVVLTNSASASASEIVSGTLQDYDRAVIAGQRTYGKGLVQVTKPLSYNTMLKVTTARYYIPTGRCIQALNYAEKNADGSVKRIPDSLKNVFKTINTGRTVYDGGGIEPDVKLSKPAYSKIAETLLSKNYIFDFVTNYKLVHDSIDEAGKFKLSENDFNDFTAFIKTKDCNYKTESEEKLEALKSATTEEKYYDAVQKQYEAIQKKLTHDKEQDMATHRNEIVTLLENEIVGRYYYAYGKAKKSYQNDPEVAKAIELLNNPQQYEQLLTVKK